VKADLKNKHNQLKEKVSFKGSSEGGK